MENQKGEKGTFLSNIVQFINSNAISTLEGSNKLVGPSNEIFHLRQTLITML